MSSEERLHKFVDASMHEEELDREITRWHKVGRNDDYVRDLEQQRDYFHNLALSLYEQ